MAHFEIAGRVFRKSSRSDTDWTKNCLGVNADCQCHADIGDSVTSDILAGFPVSEFAAFAAAADRM